VTLAARALGRMLAVDPKDAGVRPGEQLPQEVLNNAARIVALQA